MLELCGVWEFGYNSAVYVIQRLLFSEVVPGFLLSYFYWSYLL